MCLVNFKPLSQQFPVCVPFPVRYRQSKSVDTEQVLLVIDYRIVHGSFPNPVAELECVTLPWRLLQEA